MQMIAELRSGTTKSHMSPDEFAEYTDTSRNTVYRMLRRGELVAVRMGRQWRIDPVASMEKLAAKTA